MMMEKDKMLTRNEFQCFHNNRGYCKFQESCKFRHFHEECSNMFCRKKECQSRHPKICKNGENCKFYKRKVCAYRHIMENNHIKAVKVLEAEIRNLKQEINELKNTVEGKEAKLIEISAKNLDDLGILKKENKNLKHLIEKERKAHAKMEEENKDLTKEMERFKAGLVCDKCDYKSELLTEMKVHLTKTHNETKNCATCDQRYKSEVNHLFLWKIGHLRFSPLFCPTTKACLFVIFAN